MTERIGKVTLDESCYAGEDLYCDGEVEDTLLSIVKEHAKEEYPRMIEEQKSWPVLYHLSSLRENIVSWLPMTKAMKVLEIGAGCGAVTGALARRAGSVTCVDLSKKRSMINAYRHQEYDNITVRIGNFKDIEPSLDTDYDYVLLIGVFEYGQSYIGTDEPYADFMRIVKKHCAAGGRIVIAIENKYGLKYFAGCREDHVGTYFAGIEDYPGGGAARTFSRNGLIRIMERCGIADYHFYYPYPDYKFMTALYSDGYLPRVGELTNNLRNFDRERMTLFDEKNAYDGLIRDGMYAEFANSFLVVIGPQPEQLYVKFSNDRAPQYAIRTEICRTGQAEGEAQADGGAQKGSAVQADGAVQKGGTPQADGTDAGGTPCGERFVVKYPEGEEASGHVRKLPKICEELSRKYEGSGLFINECEPAKEGVRFAYVEGETLETALDRCLYRGDQKGFLELLSRYERIARYREETGPSDYDLIFSNILIGERWTLIDYEWTFPEAVSGAQLAKRALFVYASGPEIRRRFLFDSGIAQRYGITPENLDRLQQEETQFQRRVTGGQRSMAELYEHMGQPATQVRDLVEADQALERVRKFQVYEDDGSGFCEEKSYFPKNVYADRSRVRLRLSFGQGVRALRLDPANTPCVLYDVKLCVNGCSVYESGCGEREAVTAAGYAVTTNGIGAEGGATVFLTDDPNLTVDFGEAGLTGENELTMSAGVIFLSMQAAKSLYPKMPVPEADASEKKKPFWKRR